MRFLKYNSPDLALMKKLIRFCQLDFINVLCHGLLLPVRA